jgi:hypothetical protein
MGSQCILARGVYARGEIDPTHRGGGAIIAEITSETLYLYVRSSMVFDVPKSV